MTNLDYRALSMLNAVVGCGSFEKAALTLGISQSAVSQRIKALEDSAGRLLVVRGTPSVPTGLGQRLVVHYRHVKLMEASLDIDLGRAVSFPDVAVALDPDSLATWFPQALAGLLSPPRCQLDLQLAETEHALTLVREGAVYAAVAAEPDGPLEPANGTTSTALGTLRYLCVATPSFAGHWFGDGLSIEAARLAPAVVSERNYLARFLARELDLTGPFPHHTLPVSPAMQGCITGGLAYGLMPEQQARALMATDQLIDLQAGASFDVALAWHAWNIDTAFTRTLSEHIVETARRNLRQPG